MEKMYELAGDAKARLLRDEIIRNDLFYSSAIPDSLWQKQKELESGIPAYGNQIREESLKTNPDSAKISFWKDAIFSMKRESEKVSGEINASFPVFRQLLERTKPLPVDEIRKRMKRDETVVDYYISAPGSNGSGSLYIFIITRDKITFYEELLDTLFFSKAALINELNPDPQLQVEEYTQYTGALNYMYDKLVRPVEENFCGKNLIIIPDGEISWIPFDALLSSPPATGQKDFETLDYLISRYIISYSYSSSLVFNARYKLTNKVVSFLPDYRNNENVGYETLEGAGEETGSIYKWFRGERFPGERATKSNFLEILDDRNIIHLAMHSVPDTLTPGYSFLLFGQESDPDKDGKLFNYEISLSRINSPLVVISACNSGSGKLYHSEGLMSIARSFMLAGAPSVVKTSWKINDETSSQIMSSFYKYLSKGKPGNEALWLAKLDYLKKSPPAYTSPYYWAAYEIIGDISPVTTNKNLLILCVVIIILPAVLSGVYYFRRRRIAAARSL